MKMAASFLLMILGAVLGLYVGGWLCLIGGIIQIVEAIQVSPIVGLEIGIGVARILAAGVAGVFSAMVLIIPGWLMFLKSL